MRLLGTVTISAVILSFGLTLSAALQPAEAGKVCKKLKLKSPCISKSDIKAKTIDSSKVKIPQCVVNSAAM
jgi:hypothetical protein